MNRCLLLPQWRVRSRGVSWAPVLFLLSFLVAIGVIAFFYMEPLLKLANEGTPEQRKRLAAYGALALAVLILVLLVGLVLTLRFGRRLAELSPKHPKPTVYPDAWSESAKRVKAPEAKDLEDPTEGNQPPAAT